MRRTGRRMKMKRRCQMLRFDTLDFIPCPPRGYLSWNSVPETERGPLYEWEGRRAVRDRREQAALIAKGLVLVIWLFAGMVIGAGIAVAVMW
jgi:hypothetical protein